MKLVALKYYKLTDAVTGGVTKDYGWTSENTTVNRTIRFKETTPEITTSEPIVQTFHNVPKGKDVQEITEKEFDSLDISEESMTSRLRRERNFLMAKKLQATPETPIVTDEEIVAHLKGKL